MPSHPDLFEAEATDAAAAPDKASSTQRRGVRVEPADAPQALRSLAADLPSQLRFGTSSWYFPGWAGLVFARDYPQASLSRHGLEAYARHPLLRTVSLDRSFYRPLPAADYARLAAQVPDDFRFVVKAASAVTDARVREPGSGLPAQPNPLFLDPAMARDEVVMPAVDGLRHKLGVLVFQLSPLTSAWLADGRRFLAALDRLFDALPRPEHGLLALEVRDAGLLTPELAALLKAQGVRYCVGLHDRMPPLADQLPMLRATWPGALVCRWNLQRGLRYAQAKDRFEPFDRLVAPDPATRCALARLIAATVGAGQAAYVTINNKAEGSAPLSVFELAAAVQAQAPAAPT